MPCIELDTKTLLFHKKTYYIRRPFNPHLFHARVIMLRIIPTFLNPNLTLIGRRRAASLPLGLRTMLDTAFKLLEQGNLKPREIVIGDEEDYEMRARNIILQLPDGNVPWDSLDTSPTNRQTWASFLRWYNWWSTPHWTNTSFSDGFYAGQCTTCKEYSRSRVQFEKCLRPECASHVMWATVNGVAAS